MTKFDFINQYLYSFDVDFANSNRDKIILNDTYDLFIEVMKDGIIYDTLSNKERSVDYYDYLNVQGPMKREQIVFRSTYIFEKLYFSNPNIINFSNLDFLNLILILKNESAMRHFSKITEDAIRTGILKLSESDEYKLLSVMVEWCTKPKIRVAVKIWAFEVIIHISKKNKTAQELLSGLMDLFLQNPQPAIISRLKKWHQII